MTWQQYKTWLEANILQAPESEEEKTQYTLCPEAKSKYSITNEASIVTALTNLIKSIENNSSFNSDEEYHSLPDLTSLITKNKQPITWNQLFTDRTKTFFGPKTNITPLDQSTFNALTKIFNHWTENSTRLTRLQSALGEDEIMGKFLVEAVISLNYDLIKRKGYDNQLKSWLQEYEKLESSEKEQLTKQKEMVDKLLTALAEEKANRSSSAEENPNWYSNWNWKEISKWSLIGLVILLGFLLVRKLWKD